MKSITLERLFLVLNKISIDEIGKRIQAARVLTGLSREQFGKLIGVSPATIRLWEKPRANTKSLTDKASTKLTNGFKKANIVCSVEWLKTGTGIAPYKNGEVTQSFSNKSKNEKINSKIITRSNWAILKSKIPALVPKEIYSLVSSGTFGIMPSLFGFGRMRKEHNPFESVTFGVVPASYFKTRAYTEMEVLCEVSETIASLFVKYNKTLTPSILTKLTMETYKKIRSVTIDLSAQMSLINKFISSMEDGINLN